MSLLSWFLEPKFYSLCRVSVLFSVRLLVCGWLESLLLSYWDYTPTNQLGSDQSDPMPASSCLLPPIQCSSSYCVAGEWNKTWTASWHSQVPAYRGSCQFRKTRHTHRAALETLAQLPCTWEESSSCKEPPVTAQALWKPRSWDDWVKSRVLSAKLPRDGDKSQWMLQMYLNNCNHICEQLWSFQAHILLVTLLKRRGCVNGFRVYMSHLKYGWFKLYWGKEKLPLNYIQLSMKIFIQA